MITSELAELCHTPHQLTAPSRWAQRLLDLIFPPRCAGCQQAGSYFCEECRNWVQPVPNPICRRCGRPWGVGGFCVDCQGHAFAVAAIRSAAVYAWPLSAAIRQFKYQGRRGLRQALGGLLAAYWEGRPVSTDLVIPVPLHPRRLGERGFNQAELLAWEMCQATRLPLIRTGILVRLRDTPQQARLGLLDRRRNVAGAFAWHGPPLAGQRVLLIDDVATSGATLDGCAQELVEAGAGRVWALTVARAVDLT